MTNEISDPELFRATLVAAMVLVTCLLAAFVTRLYSDFKKTVLFEKSFWFRGVIYSLFGAWVIGVVVLIVIFFGEVIP